jgi:hypothetical protein
VELARAEPTELCGYLVRADARRGQERPAGDELDDHAPSCRDGSASFGVKGCARDVPTLHLEVDADEVAAGRTAGGAGSIGRIKPAAAARRGEVILERSHRPNDKGPSLPLPDGS